MVQVLGYKKGDEARFLNALLCRHVLPALPAQAAFLSALSITFLAEPGATQSTHRIRFGMVNAVPPSGTILLYHRDGALNIPALLDVSDIDIAVGPSEVGPYTDRTIGVLAECGHRRSEYC